MVSAASAIMRILAHAMTDIRRHAFFDHALEFRDCTVLEPLGTLAPDIGVAAVIDAGERDGFGRADRVGQAVSYRIEPKPHLAGIAEARAARHSRRKRQAHAERRQSRGIAFKLNDLSFGRRGFADGAEVLDLADTGDSGAALG
jgi:hypothetical protein